MAVSLRIALAAAVLAALGAGAWPAAAQQPAPRVQTPQERRWQADRLLDQGRFDEAREAYLAIAAEFADDAEFHRDLGFAFARGRTPDLARAIRAWTTSWQIDGKEDLKLEAARAHARLGQWQRGAQLLTALAAAHPQHPEHWRDAAEIAESARAFPEALEWYRRYLARRPGDATARLALARLLAGTKRHAEAIDEFTLVLAASPRSTPARLGIAQTLAWKGDFEPSLRRYDELLREQPANLDALRGKAFVLLWSGRAGEARPLFERVARRRPADREVREALAEVTRLDQAAARTVSPPALSPAEARRERLDEALRQGDGRAALALAGEALAEAPADRLLRRRLAQAHLLANEPEAAVEVLRALRGELPGDAAVLRELAQAEVRANRLAEATETLAAYLAIVPDDRGARVDRARVLSWSRRFDDATGEYRAVLQADPGNLDSRVGLAQVVAWQGRYDEALVLFDQVLASHPDQREARIGRGQALFWTGRRAEGLEAFARLQAERPEDREVASLRADLEDADRRQRIAEMDTDTSIRYHEGLLAERPQEADVLRVLGDLHARKGDFGRAADYFRQVRAVRPDDDDAVVALARALAGQRAFGEATKLLRELVDRQPTPQRRLELAQLLASAKDYRQAAEQYRAILEADAGQHEARLGLARLLSWDREFAASIAVYDEAIAREPARRDARVERARVLAWKGDLARAVEAFSALEVEFPGDRDVLLGKGQALQWSGRAREAYRVLQPLLEARPDDRDVRVAMAGTQLALGRGDLALRELRLAGAGSSSDEGDLLAMRTLALRQLRPVLSLSVNPSRDSDDLEILQSTATLHFSLLPRVRASVRGAFVPSQVPSIGRVRGREGLFGATVQAAPGVVARADVGVNLGPGGRRDAIGGGGLTVQPSATWRLEVDAAREFLNYLPLAFERGISRALVRAGADYRPGGRTRLSVQYLGARYSDDNRLHAANAALTRTLVQRPRVTLEAGYFFSRSGFAKDPANGYYAPARLQRHAALVNVSGRATPWLGYSVAGTAGAELAIDQADRGGHRPDGSFRASVDLFAGGRVRFSLGYGYARVASLARAGAYDAHAVTSGVEIAF